jgi:hypothetical protein
MPVRVAPAPTAGKGTWRYPGSDSDRIGRGTARLGSAAAPSESHPRPSRARGTAAAAGPRAIVRVRTGQPTAQDMVRAISPAPGRPPGSRRGPAPARVEPRRAAARRFPRGASRSAHGRHGGGRSVRGRRRERRPIRTRRLGLGSGGALKRRLRREPPASPLVGITCGQDGPGRCGGDPASRQQPGRCLRRARPGPCSQAISNIAHARARAPWSR